MSAEGWANFIALLALAGSAVGFWLNRREIRGGTAARIGDI